MKYQTAATLFSGGGGADIGLSEAGLDVLWGIEKDEISVELGSWRPHFVAVDRGRLLICMDETLQFKPCKE